MNLSIKLCFHQPEAKGNDGTLYYQIKIRRTTYVYASKHRICANEWDKRNERIITNNKRLSKIKNNTDWEIQQLYSIIHRYLIKGISINFSCIIAEFENHIRRQSFSSFLLCQAKRLTEMGRTRTSETYISALNSFIKFNNDEDIMLYEITTEKLEEYERYLKNRNLTMNSISFYISVP